MTCVLSSSSDGPWATTISGPLVGAVGRNVTFSCSADSHPPSQYRWFFNSTKVGEGSVLTTALSPESGGLYTCMAFNEITGSSSNVSLDLTLLCELLCLQIMYLMYCMNSLFLSLVVQQASQHICWVLAWDMEMSSFFSKYLLCSTE